jgi:hypothetical protein
LQKPVTGARHLREPAFGGDNPAHYIVLSTEKSAGLDLTHPVLAEVLINHLSWLKQEHWLKLAGFVILPRQLQLLMTPPDRRLLSAILKNFTHYTEEEINQFLKRKGDVWSRVIEEREVSDFKELQGHLDRMRRLPAEKHLIYNPSRWPWSSFHRSLEHLKDREFYSAAKA